MAGDTARNKHDSRRAQEGSAGTGEEAGKQADRLQLQRHTGARRKEHTPAR